MKRAHACMYARSREVLTRRRARVCMDVRPKHARMYARTWGSPANTLGAAELAVSWRDSTDIRVAAGRACDAFSAAPCQRGRKLTQGVRLALPCVRCMRARAVRTSKCLAHSRMLPHAPAALSCAGTHRCCPAPWWLAGWGYCLSCRVC